MIPQARLVLPTYVRCVMRADGGDVSNCMSSTAGVAFIGLPARYAQFETPLHRSGAIRLGKETATIIKTLRGDTNRALN